MPNIVLKDAVILITGANRARGIGQALVKEALKRGAKKIYATSRNISDLDSLSAKYPGIVLPLKLDVTRKDEINRIAKEASDTQILINNSGFVGMSGICFNYNEQSARQELEINYFGVLNLIRAFCKTLINNQNAAVVNVISIGALCALPLEATYCASKAAAHSLTQSVRGELKQHNVAVFGVYPGPIDTDMTEGLEFPKESPEKAAERIFNGMEQGIEDITTDLFADQALETLRKDPKIIEKEWSDFAHQMPKDFFDKD